MLITCPEQVGGRTPASCPGGGQYRICVQVNEVRYVLVENLLGDRSGECWRPESWVCQFVKCGTVTRSKT
jgi:hypothetical protein